MELRKRCTTVVVDQLPRQVGKTVGANLVNVVFPAPTTNWGNMDMPTTLKALRYQFKYRKAMIRAAKKRANKSRRANRRK